MGSLDEELRALLASDPRAMADPYPAWNELRERGRVQVVADEVFVTRYADVRQLLLDNSERYTKSMDQSTTARAFVARSRPEVREAFREYYDFINQWMVRADGEDHARLRRIAHRAFTPQRIATLKESIQRYTDELLEPIAGEREPDIMVLAYRLPLMVVVDLLGCPPADRERIHEWSMKIGTHLNRDDEQTLLAAVGAIRAFEAYVNDVIADRRRLGSGTDLVSALLDAESEERLTQSELAAMFVLLLFAGHETTTNLIGHGLHALLREREQWRRLCAGPGSAAGATEELLRFVSPVQWVTRVAAQDHELLGVRVRRGQCVAAALAAANRDPRMFEAPDELDIGRQDSRHHLALGFGPRFCLGAALARLEGQIAFETLARRFPDMQLAEVEHSYTSNAVLRRLTALPVVLGEPALATSRR
jgi:cytochrome P450